MGIYFFTFSLGIQVICLQSRLIVCIENSPKNLCRSVFLCESQVYNRKRNIYIYIVVYKLVLNNENYITVKMCHRDDDAAGGNYDYGDD